jgi:tetratricopeptide (TPR) repeat protein
MSAGHPSMEDFELFLRETSRPARSARNAQVMRHLLSRCAECREGLAASGWSQEHLARLFQLSADPSRQSNPGIPFAGAESYDYGRAFTAAGEAVSAFLAPEQTVPEIQAREIVDELASLPGPEQSRRASSRGLYSSPAVVRALVERSYALRYQGADEMLRLARLAKLAVENCTPEAAGGERKLADLQARVWGQYGNALRISSQPHDAEAALARAQEHRRNGTGDPVLRAWLLERGSSLANFRGDYRAAVEMCEEAGQIYQELGDDHAFAFTLTQKAIAILYAGDPEGAVRILNQAIPLINDEEDPHLLVAACHNLIRCYIDLDQPDQALVLYSETHEIYQEFHDPLILLRMAWQEGILLRDLGHMRAAEAALLRARKGYMEGKLSYEVALVSLDLASVYVKLGLVEEVKRTVLTTVPIFHALRVKVETLAALLQLQKVADQEQQALELIRTLDSRIKAMPKKPAA